MPFWAGLAGRQWSRKRRFWRGLDVHEWEFGTAGPRSLAVRGQFTMIPDSGPSAALRDRGRIGSSLGFAVGGAPGGA